jgi:hypothetical protein
MSLLVEKAFTTAQHVSQIGQGGFIILFLLGQDLVCCSGIFKTQVAFSLRDRRRMTVANLGSCVPLLKDRYN